MKHTYGLVALALALAAAWHSASAATLQDLETAASKSQWNDAAEIAHEILVKQPREARARLTGAFALFQAGYPNAALLFLKPLTADDWKRLPQGTDRLSEIVVLFQKKVPLTLLPSRLEQLNADQASAGLKDEIRFAKGRAAFEKQDYAGARTLLESVTPGSRFYSAARYLLATIAVQKKDYASAMAEFSRLFDPAVLSQSTEFWQDVGGSGGHSHWGQNLRIELNADSLEEAKKVGELALLGLARSAYATGEYQSALGYYDRLSKESTLSSRAALEKIWTLLALNRHEDAQKAASELAVSENGFEAIEARTLRALVLTDFGRTAEARDELEAFVKVYEQSKKAIAEFQASQVANALPAFLKRDLDRDSRIQSIVRYQTKLKDEIAALRAADHKLFPVYARLASELEPLLLQAKATAARFVDAHVARRRSDLDELFLQSKLIRAETFLEDREKLRGEFKSLGARASEDQQLEHDRRLVQLLESAIGEVDSILERAKARRTRLEFRQSELLWELSSAKGILSQSTKSQADARAADAHKQRSLRIAHQIAETQPRFEHHGQALFFTGFALTDLGQTQKGFATLERFVKLYPRHAHTPDAYRIMADIRFDANQFRAAEELYKRVLEFADSPVAGYALYKIGWCAYNLKDFSRALLAFEKANQWAQGKSDSSHLLSLQREARHDLIALYAEVGDHRKANDYFSKFFQGDTAGLLSELARELDRVGQFEKSSDLYKTLIALDPTSKLNLAYQAAIINGAYKLRRWGEVLLAAEQLKETYGPQLVAPQEDAASPAGLAEGTLREALLVQHFEASRAPTAEAHERVEKLDEIYLSIFEKWPASQDPLYRHAHFLLEHGKLERATAAFRAHWLQFRDALKEPLREEALRNLVHSLERYNESLKDAPAPSATTNEILEYTAAYEKDYSKTKHARAIRFLHSAILFRHARLDDGIKLSQALFDESPADDIGKRAFKNLRVALYEKKNWEETYEWASKLIESKAAGLSLYVPELKPVREEALFLWAEGLKDDAKSSELFLRLARDAQMGRLRDKAYYNAFVRLNRAGRQVEALGVAEELEKQFPRFENLAEIAAVRAALYQEAGDYARAAELFEFFFKSPPKAVAPETLQQARFNLALISEALGNQSAATQYYKAFLNGSGTEGQLAEAKRGLERLQSQTKPGATAAQTASFSKWAALEKQSIVFEARPLPPKGDLAQKIKQGADQLEALAKSHIALAAASETPVFYAVEALCELPFLYSAYSAAVTKLGSDPKLKPNEADALKLELAKITAPLESKAKDLADQCASRSSDAEHDGPLYRRVVAQWGWHADAKLKKAADAALARLEKDWPMVDQVKDKRSEAELLDLHHRGKATEDSRYALGLLRLKQKKLGLARLSFVDALARSPGSGRLLNALTVVQLLQNPKAGSTGLVQLFEQGASRGSGAAWANLACLHLKGARLGLAQNALKRALEEDVFENDAQLEALAKELTSK